MKEIRLSRCLSMLSSLCTLCFLPSSEPGEGKGRFGGFSGPRHGATRIPRTATPFQNLPSARSIRLSPAQLAKTCTALKESAFAHAVLFIFNDTCASACWEQTSRKTRARHGVLFASCRSSPPSGGFYGNLELVNRLEVFLSTEWSTWPLVSIISCSDL